MDSNYSLSESVAEEIRAALARKRVTGRELARRLQVSSPWVSQRLTGATEIGLNDLQRIANAIDVDLYDLLPARTRTGGGGSSGDLITVRSATPNGRSVPRQTDKRELVESRYGRAMSLATGGRPQRLTATTVDTPAQ